MPITNDSTILTNGRCIFWPYILRQACAVFLKEVKAVFSKESLVIYITSSIIAKT